MLNKYMYAGIYVYVQAHMSMYGTRGY